jgi:hypothetical protein
VKFQTVVRLSLSAAALGLASLPAFLMPACLSSSSASPDAGTGNGGGSSSGGTTVAADDGGAATGEAGAPDILDDMSSMSTSTGGYWYTYSDRTCPNSTLLIADAAGTINPLEGYSLYPAPDMVDIPAPGPGMVNYREVSGGGEKTWGLGFGFNFLNSGSNPFVNCEAGTCTGTPPDVDAAAGYPDKFDASMHKGVAFWARLVSDASSLKVNIQVSDKHTNPNGGVCNPCLNGGSMACADDYIESEAVTPTWSQLQVRWTDTALKQDGWSGLKFPIDVTTLYYIHLQVQGSVALPAPNFDVQVAYFTWID